MNPSAAVIGENPCEIAGAPTTDHDDSPHSDDDSLEDARLALAPVETQLQQALHWLREGRIDLARGEIEGAITLCQQTRRSQ